MRRQIEAAEVMREKAWMHTSRTHTVSIPTGPCLMMLQGSMNRDSCRIPNVEGMLALVKQRGWSIDRRISG